MVSVETIMSLSATEESIKNPKKTQRCLIIQMEQRLSCNLSILEKRVERTVCKCLLSIESFFKKQPGTHK